MKGRARFVSLVGVLVVSLGARAGASAELRDGQLGAPCETDDDCDTSAGWGCITAREREPGLIPGGICSVRCADEKDCTEVAARALCFERDYCVERCTINSWYGEDFSSKKCHGRTDTICWGVPNCTTCQEDTGVCLPRCTADSDCGAALYCDLGLGHCLETRPVGNPAGSPCDPFAETREFLPKAGCLGLCNNDLQRQDVNRIEGVCMDPCVIGAPHACDPENSGRACIEPLPSQGGVAGDLGLCSTLCNCSGDCPDDEVCDPWDFQGRFDAAGVCRRGPRPEAAPDCIQGEPGVGASAPCPYGELRACKTDACLGVAKCLPSGEYGECACIDDDSMSGASGGGPLPQAAEGGDAGAGGAGSSLEGPPPAPRIAGGCACRIEPQSAEYPASLLTIALGACAAVVRRRRRAGARPAHSPGIATPATSIPS